MIIRAYAGNRRAGFSRLRADTQAEGRNDENVVASATMGHVGEVAQCVRLIAGCRSCKGFAQARARYYWRIMETVATSKRVEKGF